MSKKKRKHYTREKVPSRPCPVKHAGIEEINFKDIDLLKMFLTEKGKIIPKRITGLCSRSQTRLARAVKRARNAGLLSFSEGFVQQDEVQE